LQIDLGAGQQTPLLGAADAGGGAAERPAGALAHFDEYQGGVVKHDQVDFASLAAEIALHQLQALSLQPGQGLQFAGRAAVPGGPGGGWRKLARAAHLPPAYGTTTPSW